jgi:hypothetical protein
MFRRVLERARLSTFPVNPELSSGAGNRLLQGPIATETHIFIEIATILRITAIGEIYR